MPFRATAAVTCLVASLLILCCERNPAGPDDIEIAAGPTVTDVNGNVYMIVTIGRQVWTVENWRSTKYADGTKIPYVEDPAAWAERTEPGYCYFDNTNNEDSKQKWRALYNWYVVEPVNPKKIAPDGWRIPTDMDWYNLQNYLIANGFNWDGTIGYNIYDVNKIAKALAAKTNWISSSTAGAIGNDPSKNNASGFSALPGGYRYDDGRFENQSNCGIWWSATEISGTYLAFYRSLFHNIEQMDRHYATKQNGFSIRLVRDSD